MLEYEADKDMVKLIRLVRQREEVGLVKTDVPEPCVLEQCTRLRERVFGDVNGRDLRVGAVSCQMDGLCTNAAANLKNLAPGWIDRVMV